MFDKEFYPTPNSVIQSMIADLDLNNKSVLEPHAGKGDIIDVLKQHGATVYACEKNKDLAKISENKADHFICNDVFDLKSEDISHIQYIIANPPFKNADKHIMFLYEQAPEGCVIISLCNHQTIDNRFSVGRTKLYKLIQENGSSHDLGNVFSTAERETDINIGLIKLYKPKSGNSEFEDYLFSDEEEEQVYGGSGLMQYSKIRDIVARYISGVEKYDSVMAKADEINETIKPLGGEFKLKFNAINHRGSDYFKITRDSFKKELQKSAWQSVFNEMKMDKYVTKSIKDQLNKFVEQQSAKPFTMKNIFAMITLIVGTHDSRMKKVIEETFDWLTEHYHDNRRAVEGWKTNSMYMVNKKFIAPYCGVCIGYHNQPEINWGSRGSENFSDLLKALCMITGERYEDKISLYDFFKDDRKEFGKWYDWNFFEIKVFKKGTLHAKFKDSKVWEMFNKAAVDSKGWQLPTRTGSDSRRKETGVNIF